MPREARTIPNLRILTLSRGEDIMFNKVGQDAVKCKTRRWENDKHCPSVFIGSSVSLRQQTSVLFRKCFSVG